MYSQAHWKVLHERYELVEQIVSDYTGQAREVWVALDNYDNEYLVKLWPFQTEEGNSLQRALWDTELRAMYRVSSSPGAEESLLVIRDAGLDHTYKCFVMVMQAVETSGYQTLQQAVLHRAEYPWLSNVSVDARRQLWMGLKQIAQGIQLLHSQTMLHRNVDVENVFMNPDRGPSSFRLGGFEWSVRIGELHLGQPPTGWSSPPEFSNSDSFGYQPETDWYGFGMVAVRCLLNVEAYRTLDPDKRHDRVMREIEKAPDRYLSDLEKLVLQRLIARNGSDRMARGYEIDTEIDDLLESLREIQANPIDNPLILAYNPTVNLNLIERVQEAGFVANPHQPLELFNPRDIVHCTNLSTFIQQDLAGAQLYLVSDAYVLIGEELSLKITRLRERDRRSGEETYTWDVAYCIDVMDLRWSEGGTACRELPRGSVIVRAVSEVRSDSNERARAQNWERYLPSVDKSSKLRASLAQFHDFIRCTNQIELLMRDAELFQYEIVNRSVKSHVETLEIREVERSREVMDILKPEWGLIQFLQREIESNKENCRLVVLSPEDSLRFDRGTRIEPKDCFQVDDFKLEDDTMVLKRSSIGNVSLSAPDRGWLRPFGIFGQIDLIRRRKEAIDRLANHAYLLKALCATGQSFMDTEDVSPPQFMATDRVDESKQAVMADIRRTRPIYTLQGPPGTGKTTMVAHLLRQIFEEDPVAQVLITAQAHGAVDVLRTKVRDEAFEDVAEAKQPLAIRLGRNNRGEGALEGSVESVAERILQLSIEHLNKAGTLSKIQQEWRQHAQGILGSIKSRSVSHDAPEFLETVKRGANITYCTTSAGDLEELARSTQFYDWAIIEEAGKCHGFDLALPLHAGHRWLLIGDQYQLGPYRWNDYSKALVNLEDVVDSLKSLPNHAAGLLDLEWIHRWEAMDIKEQSDFKEIARGWLNTFHRIFENCEAAPNGSSAKKKTEDEAIGAAAGMLKWQYRMHPTIGTLISEAYYNGELKNRTITEDGQPEKHVVLQVAKPEAIRGMAIVWIDTPAASKDDIAREFGPTDGKPRYTNPYEVKAIKGFLAQLELDTDFLAELDLNPSRDKLLKLAVLSPYNQQVSLIRQQLSDVKLPEGISPKEALRTPQVQTARDRPSLAHTVDSFQGNEADIIVVSLVRNSKGREVHGRPLGFLEDPERMNVLLSRAQRLLVLVGSWEFFFEQVEPFSLEDKSRREQWHLKKVMTMLEGWFNSGEAVKLSAAEFTGVFS